ncbi:MAG: hypothetical protein OHK0022_35660 [Roseiflexaceae bacterium]
MSDRPAASEERHKTGPLELPPGGLAVPAAPNPRRRHLLIGLAVAAVALVLTGLVVFVVLPGQAASRERPVEVVKDFAQAVEAKDPSKMLSYIEPTIFRREVGGELRTYIEYINQIRFVDARYELIENDGTLARVRWRATVQYDLRERGSGEYAFDNEIELANVEGSWYLRSVRLPEP